MTVNSLEKVRRRAILEIATGRLACRKAILVAGQSVRVGRTDFADLVIPHDHHMSGIHWSLSWDGERCLVSDLKSATGTLLQGQRVEVGEAAHGAWIRAGETDFRVYFEAHTPPPSEIDLTTLAAEKRLAIHILRQVQAPLFAVVDAAAERRIIQLVRESVDEHRSLYDGIKGETLANVAPYLVGIRRDSGFLERLVTEGFGSRWGIFLSSKRPFTEVRRHLRRFLLVEDDDTGEKYYFRYYDPRALRGFLPKCTVRQRDTFFGDVSAYLAEGESGELLLFSPSQPEGSPCQPSNSQ